MGGNTDLNSASIGIELDNTGDEPFADAHALCSLEEAVAAMQIADDIRGGPDGYWVEPWWLAIASDGAGQYRLAGVPAGEVAAIAGVPACFSRATTVASRDGTLARWMSMPAAVATPSVLQRSFTAIGTP